MIKKCHNHRAIVNVWYIEDEIQEQISQTHAIVLTREIYLEYETRENDNEMS